MQPTRPTRVIIPRAFADKLDAGDIVAVCRHVHDAIGKPPGGAREIPALYREGGSYHREEEPDSAPDRTCRYVLTCPHCVAEEDPPYFELVWKGREFDGADA